MIDKEKSLAYRFPELAKEWHHTKYGDLTPFNVAEDVIQTYGTSNEAFWPPVCWHHFITQK